MFPKPLLLKLFAMQAHSSLRFLAALATLSAILLAFTDANANLYRLRARPLKPVMSPTPTPRPTFKPKPSPAPVKTGDSEATPTQGGDAQAGTDANPGDSTSTPAPTPTPSPSPTPLPNFEGKAEASATLTTGNTNTRNVGTSLQLLLRRAPWAYQFKGRYLSSSSEGALTAEQTQIEIRSGRSITERTDVFADLEFLNDRFAGLAYQVTPDVGYGYEWILADPVQLRTEAALGLALEHQTQGVTTEYPIGRLGFLFAWRLTDKNDFGQEVSALLNFADTSDWRLRSETWLSTGVTKTLALKISHRYEFTNAPLLGKVKDNTLTMSSLVLKF